MKVLHIPGAAPLYTNTFLVISEAGSAVVIDAAADATVYEHVLEENHATLKHILLTHGHYDHVGGAEQLARDTGADIYLDVSDVKGDSLFPLCGHYTAYTDGGELKMDELVFRTWHTPGHTEGSWCIWCGGILFSGDTLFAGSCGRVDMPGGSARKMQASLSKLADLPLPDETQVCPGHESFSTLGAERRHNPYMRGDFF